MTPDFPTRYWRASTTASLRYESRTRINVSGQLDCDCMKLLGRGVAVQPRSAVPLTDRLGASRQGTSTIFPRV